MRVRFARSCLRERECLLRYSYLLTARENLLFCFPRPRSLGLCPGRAVRAGFYCLAPLAPGRGEGLGVRGKTALRLYFAGRPGSLFPLVDKIWKWCTPAAIG